MGAKLEDTVAINREIIHGYYQGDLAPWFSRLCSKSVWLGIGERVLFGEGAIRDYFKDYLPPQPCRIFREEHYPLPLGPRCEAVVSEVTVGGEDARGPRATAMYTFVYQLLAGETKLVLLHAGYEFLRTLFVQPHAIFYVQSRNRRTELHCVDTVIESELSITALNAMLPHEFCPIHRCFTVNSRYVTAIQRCEVTMVTGETLPVPVQGYTKVKAQLQGRILGQKNFSNSLLT